MQEIQQGYSNEGGGLGGFPGRGSGYAGFDEEELFAQMFASRMSGGYPGGGGSRRYSGGVPGYRPF